MVEKGRGLSALGIESLDMSALVWASLGLILIAIEVLTQSFVLIFFGGAALLVAILKWMGVSHLATEIFLFGFLGASGVIFMRKLFLRSLAPSHGFKVDSTLRLDNDIPARSQAPIQYQGALWTVVNDSNEKLNRGAVVRIVRHEGVRLYVSPEPEKS